MHCLSVYGDGIMIELRRFAKSFLDNRGWSYRRAEEETSVARSTWDRLINDESYAPTNETIFLLSKAFNLPRWRVYQMAGIELDLETTQSEVLKRLVTIAEVNQEMRPLVDFLIAHPEQISEMYQYSRFLEVKGKQDTH